MIASILEIINNHLCEMYKTTRFISRNAEWPPNQPHLLVNVALIHYKGKRTQQELFEIAKIHKEGTLAVDKATLSTYQGPSTKKPRLDFSRVTKKIADIFAADPADLTEPGTSSTETPKRILIEGAPGIGKTVLAREIAYQWATNEILTEIKILFLLYLRDPQLQSIKTTKQLVEYVSMGSLNDEQITTFNRYLVNSKGQQLCVVMDGFDEYPPSLQENSFIVDIINCVVLSKATVVITSRPTSTVSLHDRVVRRIDILGLPKEERENYISKVFSDSPKKKDELEKYLKEQPVISGFCFVPLHLAVLLYLFQQGSLPKTLTEMNESFILHTIYRNLKKHGKTPPGLVENLVSLPKPILDIVYDLSKLAFKGVQENKLVFTFAEIIEVCPCINKTVGTINGFGLLQAVEHYPQKGAGTTTSFNFLHYTMQEYLAALHVSNLPSEQQQLSLMKETFWDGHYNFMWMMFVGIKSDIFVNFVSKGKVYKRKNGIRMAEYILKDKRKRLFVFQCYMEAKSFPEAPDVISDMFKDNEVIINGVKLLPHHVSSLMSFMSNSPMQWKALELKQCKIADIGMSVLEQFISEKTSTLEYVDLSGNESSPWGVYCAIIRHCSVNNLTLSGVQASEMKDYVDEIIKSLNCASLKSLTLCNIRGKIELIKTVLSTIDTLTVFNLPCRRVIDSKDNHKVKAVLFHTALHYKCDDTVPVSSDNKTVNVNVLCNKTCDSTVSCVDASHQCIDDYGISLITVFCNKACKVDLSHNKISDDGATFISDYFKNNICLLELNLSNNKITSEGAKQIAKAIRINTVLQDINLSGNYISTEGLVYFIKAVKNNCTLQVVNITHNNVTRSGFTSIKQCIENLRQSIIYASWNEINENGKLVTKIVTSRTPDNIEDDMCSFGVHDPDHLVMCLSECLKEDDTIKEFDLCNKIITNEGATMIGKTITINETLQKLDVCGSSISDGGAAAICDGLKSNNSLLEFDISNNDITSQGADKIAEAIKVNITLQKLSIHGNSISDDGAAAISDALKYNKSLQELDMSDNNITSKGAVEIFDAIKVNTTLKELIISNNKIMNKGAINVSEAIEVNKTLQKLYIDGNNISDAGTAAISDGLKKNNCLQELNMSFNNITKEGAKMIAEAILVNKCLRTLNLFHTKDAQSFNMTVLTAVYHNNTLMNLTLPYVYGDEVRLVSSEVKKIKEERTRQGISTLTCTYHR